MRRVKTPKYGDEEEARHIVFESVMHDMNIVDHHVTNFNDLCSTWLKEIVLKHGNISTEFKDSYHTTELQNYKFTHPSITPRDAHRFNTSYFATITVDIKEVHVCKYQNATKTLLASSNPDYPYIRTNQTHIDTKLCEFPMMVQGDCNSQFPEWGGRFITSGKTRYIPLLKSLMNNYPFRFDEKLAYTVHIRSLHLDKKHRSTSSMNVQIKKHPGIRSIVFNSVFVMLPYLKLPVPMTILIMALGDISIDEFIEEVTESGEWKKDEYNKYIIMLQNDHHGCNSRETALGFISKLYKRTDVMSEQEQTSRINTLYSVVLPHLNSRPARIKSLYLAYLFRMVVRFKEGAISATNRDSFVFTRITDAASSLALLFRMLYLKFIEQCGKILRRGINQKGVTTVGNVYNDARLTKKLRSALATGQWSSKRVGVSHQLNTTNNNSILSQLRRVSSSYLNNDGKHIEPRMLKADSYGYTCAAETPDGEHCGLVSSLASTCRITRGADHVVVMDILVHKYKKVGILQTSRVKNSYELFDPDGKPTGFVTDIDAAVREFVLLRRSMTFDHFATYYRDDEMKELRIHCCIGRMVRPLIVLENVHKVVDIIKWFKRGGKSSLIGELMIHGCIEYVSSAEEKSIRVALSPTRMEGCTHLELSDVSFVGIVAALAPFFRHNQGPRLVYWVGMTKQAIWHSKMPDLGSITKHRLWYGHKPLVATRMSHILNMDQSAIGTNVLIAIYPHPYCQEDAVVVNKGLIDRGFGISEINHVQESNISRKRARSKPDDTLRGANSLVDEQFHRVNPKQTLRMRIGSRHAIRRDGLSRPGDKVNKGDIIISKTAPMKRFSETAKAIMPEEIRSVEHQQKRYDKSVQAIEKSRVSAVFHAQKPTGDIVKVQTTSVRVPEEADKFSPEHSQKCVFGKIIPIVDMPVVMRTGTAVGMLINPEGFPSRMTVGMLAAMLFGNAVVATGDLGVGIDDQLFDIPLPTRLKVIQRILVANGCPASGRERLLDGTTGEMIRETVFCGFISYSKLNHMVSSKSYARSTGAINMINRQATLGRSLGGGIRFGNMESECVVSHAGSEMMRERMLTVADEFKMYMCKDCGHAADGNKAVGMFFCRFCQTTSGVRTVKIPYTTKLMSQSLLSCGIKPVVTLK